MFVIILFRLLLLLLQFLPLSFAHVAAVAAVSSLLALYISLYSISLSLPLSIYLSLSLSISLSLISAISLCFLCKAFRRPMLPLDVVLFELCLGREAYRISLRLIRLRPRLFLSMAGGMADDPLR